ASVRAHGDPAAPSADQDPQGFDRFFKAYPKRVGEAKARLEWQKLKPTAELQGTMLAALREQKCWKQWQEKTDIPEPGNWLREPRWMDQCPDGRMSIREKWEGQPMGEKNWPAPDAESQPAPRVSKGPADAADDPSRGSGDVDPELAFDRAAQTIRGVTPGLREK